MFLVKVLQLRGLGLGQYMTCKEQTFHSKIQESWYNLHYQVNMGYEVELTCFYCIRQGLNSYPNLVGQHEFI